MISLKDYFTLCNSPDYILEKNRFCKKFNIGNVVLFALANIVWTLTDILGCGLPITLKIILLSISFRIAPVALTTPIALKKIQQESTYTTEYIQIFVWAIILSAFIGLPLTAKLCPGYLYSSDGTLAFYIIFYVFSMTAHQWWVLPTNAGILSLLIWIFSLIVDAPIKLGVRNIVSYGILITIPLWISSCAFKLLYSKLYTTSQKEQQTSKMYQEVAQMYKEVARRDALTGCYNRSAMDDLTEPDGVSSIEDCTVILIDVDNFKTINDTKGHSFGDTILKDTVQAAMTSIGVGDEVIRYGGDEFVVYLTSGIYYKEFFEAFLQARSQSVLDAAVTYSMGAYHVHKGEDLFKGIKKADAALYNVKSSGKNDIQLFTN